MTDDCVHAVDALCLLGESAAVPVSYNAAGHEAEGLEDIKKEDG